MTLALRCRFALSADAGEQAYGGFITFVLGDQFAAEGFGEDRLVQPAHQLQRALCLFRQPVDLGEGGFDATDDFVLSFVGWPRQGEFFDFTK